MQHSALKWSKISTSNFRGQTEDKNEMQILTKHYITISYINQLIPVSESDTTAPQIKEYSFRLNVFEKALLIFYEQSNTGII